MFVKVLLFGCGAQLWKPIYSQSSIYDVFSEFPGLCAINLHNLRDSIYIIGAINLNICFTMRYGWLGEFVGGVWLRPRLQLKWFSRIIHLHRIMPGYMLMEVKFGGRRLMMGRRDQRLAMT